MVYVLARLTPSAVFVCEGLLLLSAGRRSSGSPFRRTFTMVRRRALNRLRPPPPLQLKLFLRLLWLGPPAQVYLLPFMSDDFYITGVYGPTIPDDSYTCGCVNGDRGCVNGLHPVTCSGCQGSQQWMKIYGIPHPECQGTGTQWIPCPNARRPPSGAKAQFKQQDSHQPPPDNHRRSGGHSSGMSSRRQHANTSGGR